MADSHVLRAIDSIDSAIALLQCAVWAAGSIEDGNPIAATVNAGLAEVEGARTQLEILRDATNEETGGANGSARAGDV